VIFASNKRSADTDFSLISCCISCTRMLNVANAVGHSSNSRRDIAASDSATAGRQVRRETGAQITVHQAVNCEIEASVQVRQHGRVEVDGQRWTGSGRLCESSYNNTTMYGVQQQTNKMKMINTVFTWRIVFTTATYLALVASCSKRPQTYS